jgi:hypothetical protein
LAYILQNVIDEALQVLRIIGPGESLSSGQYADLVRTANLVIDDWNAQEEFQGGFFDYVFTLTPGLRFYKIGPVATAPNFNAPRPSEITKANLFLPTGSIFTRMPIEIIDADELTSQNPTDLPNSQYPRQLYYTGDQDAQGAATLILWPTPTIGYQIELVFPGTLGSFALTDPLNLPPGYARAMVYNFAVAFAPKFGKSPSADIVTQAMTGLQRIRIDNYRGIRTARNQSTESHWDFRAGDWIGGS